MSYNRTFWENGITPINADNLNNLEEGVFANAEALSSVNENMSALSEETETLQTNIETLETSIGDLETDVETLEISVETVQTSVGTIQTDVSTLRTDVDVLLSSGGGGEIPAGLLSQSDVVDNLLSEATNLPLSANQGRVLKAEVDECFQSVSNGKALVASAITDKGIPTDATATFTQMATNIENISVGLSKNAKVICDYDYEIDGLTWTTSGLTTGVSNGYRYIGKTYANGSATSNIIDNSEEYAYVRICPVGMEGNDRTFVVYNESGSQLGAQFVQGLTAPIKIATKGAKKIKIGVNFSTSATNVSTYLTNVVLCNS